MEQDEFFARLNTGRRVEPDGEMFEMFHHLAQEALKITMVLNNQYHAPDEVRALFSALTGRQVDPSFRLFPPFYTDCGKNISVGKNVFINACCKFQDQAGITIDDGTFVGHNVTIATINHDFHPESRAAMYPKAVRIGKNVWIGSDCTILPGITIADGAVVGAGSVVTKDVASNTVVAGNPARVIKKTVVS